jgi:hypothetical protein
VPANLTDYEGAILAPDDEPPNRSHRKDHRRIERLRPLPGPYVRVPIQWLCNPCRTHVFAPEARLFLYVLYRSHWGQRGVAMTRAVVTEIGVPRETARDALGQLARKGWVRVERRPGHALIVWPIVLAA